MSDDQRRIEVIRIVLGKDWEPHVDYPATFHNRRPSEDLGDNRAIRKHDTHPCHVKPSQNLLRRLMSRLDRLRTGR